MMSVVGFDVGNDSCVIAAVKQRGVDVLLNDESKRETPSVVCFGEKQRYLGLAGAASAARFPRSTLTQIKRFVGRQFRHPDVQADLSRLPFRASEAPDGGVLIHVSYLDQERAFTPVEILGMLLAHLKQIAEKSLETTVSDCVIGVPSYFTDLQRRAYLDAAAIAGLKPLRLMHDSAATALGYGLYRSEAGPHNSSIHVVFVDVGHCDTQVSVVLFRAGKLQVLSHAFHMNLGGRDFDEILFDHFADHFRLQDGIDVKSNVRASIRLRAACEKLKKVLSANSEAPLSIECLMDEKDVKGFITRDEFEKLSAQLLDRFLEPCRKALEDANLKQDSINAVELVGSGSRIPAISRILTEFFRREASRTVNASECVAIGCALHAAMLSPIFRVKDYEVQDSFPFSVGFATEEGPIILKSGGPVFRKGQLIPSVKYLSIIRSKPFKLEAFYANESEIPPDMPRQISGFQIGSFQASEGRTFKVKVKIRLSLHGTIVVDSASLFEVDANKNLAMSDTSHIDNMELDSDSGAKSDTPMPNGVYEHNESGSTTSHDTRKTERSPARYELPVTEVLYGGMTKELLVQAQEQEMMLANQDILMEQTKERKNALEAYVYEVRNKLFERYRSFASDSERGEISTSLQQTEEWLYDEGDDETEDVYVGKLQEIKKLVIPVESRFKEEEARAQATRELLNCIVDYRMAVKSLSTYERDFVANECNKAEQWLRERSSEQERLPKNADTVLWSNEIRKRAEELDISCGSILKHKPSSRTEDSRGRDHSNTDKMQTD